MSIISLIVYEIELMIKAIKKLEKILYYGKSEKKKKT